MVTMNTTLLMRYLASSMMGSQYYAFSLIVGPCSRHLREYPLKHSISVTSHPASQTLAPSLPSYPYHLIFIQRPLAPLHNCFHSSAVIQPTPPSPSALFTPSSHPQEPAPASAPPIPASSQEPLPTKGASPFCIIPTPILLVFTTTSTGSNLPISPPSLPNPEPAVHPIFSSILCPLLLVLRAGAEPPTIAPSRLYGVAPLRGLGFMAAGWVGMKGFVAGLRRDEDVVLGGAGWEGIWRDPFGLVVLFWEVARVRWKEGWREREGGKPTWIGRARSVRISDTFSPVNLAS